MRIHHYFTHDSKPSLPNSRIKYLYDRMVEEGTAETVFEDGTITNRDEFLQAMQTTCRLHIVMDADEPIAVVWLNRFEGKTARLHFCFFKPAWGSWAVHVGKFIITTLLNLKFDGEYVYDVLVGYIPDKNRAALTLFHKLGVKVVGSLPLGHWNNRTGQSESCTIVYADRGCL